MRRKPPDGDRTFNFQNYLMAAMSLVVNLGASLPPRVEGDVTGEIEFCAREIAFVDPLLRSSSIVPQVSPARAPAAARGVRACDAARRACDATRRGCDATHAAGVAQVRVKWYGEERKALGALVTPSIAATPLVPAGASGAVPAPWAPVAPPAARTAAVFPVRTPPAPLRAYLRDARVLKIDVADAGTHVIVARGAVPLDALLSSSRASLWVPLSSLAPAPAPWFTDAERAPDVVGWLLVTLAVRMGLDSSVVAAAHAAMGRAATAPRAAPVPSAREGSGSEDDVRGSGTSSRSGLARVARARLTHVHAHRRRGWAGSGRAPGVMSSFQVRACAPLSACVRVSLRLLCVSYVRVA